MLKYKYYISPKVGFRINIDTWKEAKGNFLFQSRDNLCVKKKAIMELQIETKRIYNGEICFFDSTWFKLGTDYDWVTNPTNGYVYDISKHWSEIETLNSNGDIKYVWEKSRFAYLLKIIRCDYHFGEDHSCFVFSEILDWIDHNPVEYGPNYVCSQAISFRLLNWIFALYFYKNSLWLSPDIFEKIMLSIYFQLKHVYNNIDFSRKFLHNDHTISESLVLYISGILFPFVPDSKKWRDNGKKWFEKEIKSQIDDDGTYMQYSMNYHRLIIQHLSLAFAIASKNEERFSGEVYLKAYKSLNFLFQCQDEKTGELPKYGSEDGILLFNLSNASYHDYRPQLNALCQMLTGQILYGNNYEEYDWYNVSQPMIAKFPDLKRLNGLVVFEHGGYYLMREESSLTFIRCGTYWSRPGQADNLHLDIWWNGRNVVYDAGTYRYNTEPDLIKYFSGAESHNVVMLDQYGTMMKGPRFTWLYWTRLIEVSCKENKMEYVFTGRIEAFRYLGKKIIHERCIVKKKREDIWIVTDTIHNKPDNLCMRQIWHSDSSSVFVNSEAIKICKEGSTSPNYGIKKNTEQMEFQVRDKNEIVSIIKIK